MGTQLRRLGMILSPRSWAVCFVTVSALALLQGCEEDTKAKTEPNSSSGNNAIPSIDSLTIPGYVPANLTVPFTAQISGDADTSLKWTVTSAAGEGTFAPSTGTIKFDANGEAELNLSYTAPNSVGHYIHQLAVTDEDNDSADASMGIDVRGVGVALFADPMYVNYSPGLYWMEASNVEASLASQGHPVLPFTGITDLDFQAATQGKAALAIPWLWQQLNLFLDPAGLNAIEQFVANGGMLIVNDDSYRAPQLLNAVFGFTLGTSVTAVTSLNLNSQIDPDSPFANGPTPLSLNSMVWSVNASNLPPNTTPIYSGPGGMTVVFLTKHGSGYILYLGWSWYDALPTGTQDGGWLNVLDRAVNAAETGKF